MSPDELPGEVDCLVLGGGITGAGVARDAAMRGLRTLLIDSHDFASGTSHLTSKLIHGGLRYLEHCHFRLVAEGILERHRLLNRLAPNLVSPLRFIMPFEGRRFAKWFVTVCGLQAYGFTEWWVSGRRSSPVLRGTMRSKYPLLRPYPFAVSFWDARTNDARLVMAVLRTARQAGAVLRNYTTVSAANFDGTGWTIDASSASRNWHGRVRAKLVVNATGPWSPLTAKVLGVEPMKLLWIKGSHLLLRRPAGFGDDAIVIRSIRDLRPLWVIPWETRLIVGSTECRYNADLRDVHPTAEEVDDLFESVVHCFPGAGITRGDILGAYAGVRPIVEQDGVPENSLSRRHELTIDARRRLITITGGKLTTFRRMAETTVDKVDRLLGRAGPSSGLRRRLRGELLWPGLTGPACSELVGTLERRFHGRSVSAGVVAHLVRHYGQGAEAALEDVARDPARGEPLFEGLPHCLAELAYLCRTEDVHHLVDLVKRRTPLYFLADRAGERLLPNIAAHIAPILSWSSERQAEEMNAVAAEYRADCRAFSAGSERVERTAPLAVCA